MKKYRKPTDQHRRDFLRGSVATGAGVVIATAVPVIAVASTSDDAVKQKKSNAGYQLSQHVVDYYKTCAR